MLYILFPVWVSPLQLDSSLLAPVLSITASWAFFLQGLWEAGLKLPDLKQIPGLVQFWASLLRCHLFIVSWVIWCESFPLQAHPQTIPLHHQSINCISRLWRLQVCPMVIEHPFSIWLLEVSSASLFPLSCVLLFGWCFQYPFTSFMKMFPLCLSLRYSLFFLVLTLFLY